MKQPKVSETAKTTAKRAAAAIGGAPSVHIYWDEDERSHVGLLSSADRPDRGVTTYSTVGLAEHPVHRNDEEMPFRLEFCGACRSEFAAFDQIIATAAFFVINSKWYCEPGMIFDGLVSMYDASSTMEHLLFLPPFLWEDLSEFHVDDLTVAWLLAVPISDAERGYAVRHDWNKLEDLFVERQIDIFDLERPSEV
jgi:hypothetical protein